MSKSAKLLRHSLLPDGLVLFSIMIFAEKLGEALGLLLQQYLRRCAAGAEIPNPRLQNSKQIQISEVISWNLELGI
jgi:hypothetical protein